MLLQTLRSDAEEIMRRAIAASMPDAAVCAALKALPPYRGKLYVLVVGKAAWRMAAAAAERLGARVARGLVITKYGHLGAPIPRFTFYEAGHPLPDENSFLATEAALTLTESLCADDLVLFLLSGGGSALFEKPLVPPEELAGVTSQLLRSGASIAEMNMIRKRLSAVKGGRFAAKCAPARVYSIVLSDVLSDVPDQIASGPTCADTSTSEQALAIAKKYALTLLPETAALLKCETCKTLMNATLCVGGSVRGLCAAAADACRALGYRPILLTTGLCCEAREAGSFLASIAAEHQKTNEPLAFLAGGETVVRVSGKGLGGRNQELALSAARGLAGVSNAAVFSFGSDGTDGPTDAAGGFVDGETLARLAALGLDAEAVLAENDSYHALRAAGDLLVTGPTGTNVNDLSAALIRPR